MLAVKQSGEPPVNDPAGELANLARLGAASFGDEELWQTAHTAALFGPVFVCVIVPAERQSAAFGCGAATPWQPTQEVAPRTVAKLVP
jgi:hypothetical protein